MHFELGYLVNSVRVSLHLLGSRVILQGIHIVHHVQPQQNGQILLLFLIEVEDLGSLNAVGEENHLHVDHTLSFPKEEWKGLHMEIAVHLILVELFVHVPPFVSFDVETHLLGVSFVRVIDPLVAGTLVDHDFILGVESIRVFAGDHLHLLFDQIPFPGQELFAQLQNFEHFHLVIVPDHLWVSLPKG